jgi:hypothetical protein
MIEGTVEKRYYSLEEGDWDWCVCFFGKAYPFGNDEEGRLAALSAVGDFPEEGGPYYSFDDGLKRLEDIGPAFAIGTEDKDA